MSIRRNILVVGIVIVAGFVISALPVRAVVMSPSPQTETVSVDSTFPVEIRLDSEQEFINVVQAVITYPTDLLSVQSIEWGDSFLTMWVQQPTVVESSGMITLTGGKPNGTLVVDSPVVTITFRARTLGTATVHIDREASSVHLNDGNGTDTDLTTIDGTYDIANASPYALDISSPTHPDQDAWYPQDTFIAEWQPRGSAFYSYTLGASPADQPDEFVDDPQDQAVYSGLADGVHYFVLNEKLPNDVWETVGARRVKVDTTPPLPISAIVSRDGNTVGGRYFLSFNTYDATSGVDHYEVVEGSQLVSPARSPYLLTDQANPQKIVVRAFDRAGNKQETIIDHTGNGRVADEGFDTNILLLTGISIGIIALVLGGYMIRQRKKRI